MATLNTGKEEESGENQQKVRLVEMGPRFKLKFLSFQERSGQVEEEGVERELEDDPERKM